MKIVAHRMSNLEILPPGVLDGQKSYFCSRWDSIKGAPLKYLIRALRETEFLFEIDVWWDTRSGFRVGHDNPWPADPGAFEAALEEGDRFIFHAKTPIAYQKLIEAGAKHVFMQDKDASSPISGSDWMWCNYGVRLMSPMNGICMVKDDLPEMNAFREHTPFGVCTDYPKLWEKVFR